ncbi:MAG TPA: GNAT family N-acetyltransferase [Candidatus Saccharimonadia bacterium]|nr:GNAT family N-acetyltransferase [Candidatus Saccharimonadia bacterium]
MEDVRIREATTKDLLRVARLEGVISIAKYPNRRLGITAADMRSIEFGSGRAAKYRRRFLDNPAGNLWVAEADGQLVAFAAGTTGEYEHWLRKLYVASAWQRQGLGARLLAVALDWFEPGKDIIANVASYDQPSIEFFRRHGFVERGMRPSDETVLPNGKILPEVVLRRPGEALQSHS